MVQTLGCWPLICALLAAAAEGSSRVISIADLHGDYDRTVEILKAAGLVDPGTLAWVGGDATLVQTGDIVDRGDRAKEIYQLFFRLADEARSSGGQVINLLGNHELMNLQGDLRYVSEGDFLNFGGKDQRERDWAPTGWLGQRVRQFPVAAKAGDVLFVHAGLSPQFLDGTRGLSGLNDDVHSALSESRNGELLGRQGPLWTRFFGRENDEVCAAAKAVLERVGAARMVLGHTIQRSREGFRARATCGGRIVLADTAISSAYDGEMSFIEHTGEGGAAVHYTALGTVQRLPVPGTAGEIRREERRRRRQEQLPSQDVIFLQ